MLILNIKNIGGPDHAAQYDVTVHVNTRQIWYGSIGPHDRSHGWEALVRQIADAALRSEGEHTNETRRECPTCKTTKVIKNESEQSPR